jgi:small-conductance mechanosensitive channel
MFERRVVFLTDVAYDTPADVVARIPTMLKEIIAAQHPVRFDRSHFNAFTDSALRVETVYFVLDPDFNRYCDIQQAINLELLRRFAAEGISFAHPMRAVHVFEHAPSVEEQPGVVRVDRAASRLR